MFIIFLFRRKVYSILENEGIELPRYAVLDRESEHPSGKNNNVYFSSAVISNYLSSNCKSVKTHYIKELFFSLFCQRNMMFSQLIIKA